jgi:5,6-dimethylbenzimidazole synthase
MDLTDVISLRRDTRHILPDPIERSIIFEAIYLADKAPSVGQTKPTRYVFVESENLRQKIKQNFDAINSKVSLDSKNHNKSLYKELKLESILEAPIGMVICCDLSEINKFSIGTPTQARDMLIASTVCAIHTFWLALTNVELTLGWVSILDFDRLKIDLDLNPDYFPLGYFCIGKPETNYDGIPMLSQRKWNSHLVEPNIEIK